MDSTEVLVIGAGQAGLAVSRCLTDAAIDHVVLDRGHVAERWRSERWDSLRLLTPNWATRLPGWSYAGCDPDGFMSARELVSYFDAYAESFAAPVRSGQHVRSLDSVRGWFEVRTDDRTWRADEVVIATGWSDQPFVPPAAAGLHRSITQITPSSYRNPAQLPAGGVLVVGASASGVQLADELARSGRDVVLAVGRHARVPRRYRGLDIWWWLDRVGILGSTIDEIDEIDGVDDQRQVRLEPSLQLIGRNDGRDVDLSALQRVGVRLAGRLVDVDGATVCFADDLAVTTSAAQHRLETLLAGIDACIERRRLAAYVLPPMAINAVDVSAPVGNLDLRSHGIGTVIWATGYVRPYEWLRLPVLDRTGEIVQTRGITPCDGLYVVGQRFQHRRDSNFIDGVRHDAAFIVDHINDRRDRHVAA